MSSSIHLLKRRSSKVSSPNQNSENERSELLNHLEINQDEEDEQHQRLRLSHDMDAPSPLPPVYSIDEENEAQQPQQQQQQQYFANQTSSSFRVLWWPILTDVMFTFILGTKESSLTSRIVPKYFSKGKFIEQPMLRASRKIQDRQTRAYVAFMSIFFLFMFMYCTLDVVYIVIHHNVLNAVGMMYICLCIIMYLMLRSQYFQTVRLVSIAVFTLIPYCLITLNVMYSEQLTKLNVYLVPPFSQYQKDAAGETTIQSISSISASSIILFPVALAAMTSSPVLVLLVFIINFILVGIQPIWLRHYMPFNYIEYMMNEIYMVLPVVFMVLVNSYMHSIDILQILEGERRYKNILGLTTEAIVVQDATSGTILDINPSFQKYFGYSLRECRELGIEDFLNLHMKTRYEFIGKEQAITMYQKRQSVNFTSWGECLGITRDGLEFPVEIVFKRSEYNGREVDVYVIRDLRERKEIQKQYEAAQHARTELQSRTKFFAMVSHDLKTPLNSIYLIAQKLLEKYEEKDKELVTMIVDSCRILSNIIKDVLYSTKLDSGSLALETSRFNIKRCIETVVSISGVTALRKGLDVALELDTNPSSAKIPDFVYGDSSKFQQILTNLLGNAIKFTQVGSVIVKVVVAEQSYNSVKLYVSVKDTGIGIPVKKQPQLFKMFSRAHEDRKFEGTGLGLAICKNLCTLMKGEIGVNSVYGEGSEFWFTAVFETRQRHSSVDFTPFRTRRFSSSSSVFSGTSMSESTSRRGSMKEMASQEHQSQDKRPRIALSIDVENIYQEQQEAHEEEANRDITQLDDETSDSFPSEESLYLLSSSFCFNKLQNTIVLVIYKNDQVRDSIQRYLSSFSLQSVCIQHPEPFFLNAKNVKHLVQETLYGSTANANPSKRDEWLVKLPISCVIFDDALLLYPDGITAFRRASVVGLFDPASSPKKSASVVQPGSNRFASLTGSSLERIYQTVNRLKQLVSNHNLKVEGHSFPNDLVFYGCLYYTFDISYLRDYCTTTTNEKVFKKDFKSEEFIDLMIRKPLSLSGIAKLISQMMEKHETHEAKQIEQMHNETVYNFVDNMYQTDDKEHVSLNSYQFPPPPTTFSVHTTQTVVKTIATGQRKSGPTHLSNDKVFDNNSHYRKSSVPVTLLYANHIRHHTRLKIRESDAVLAPPQKPPHRCLRTWKSTEDIFKSQDVSIEVEKSTSHQIETSSSTVFTTSDMSSILGTNKPVVEAEKENELTLHVLVADDSSINRKIVTRILQDCSSANANDKKALPIMKTLGLKAVNIKPVPVADGAAALEEFVDKYNSPDLMFDLILLDVHMDGMGGIECAEKIREHESKNGSTRCLMIGITGDNDATQKCLRAGMDTVLGKPVTQEKLRKLVESVIQQKLKQT